MLKVYHANSFYKVDDGDWKGCGTPGYAVMDEDLPKEKKILDRVGWESVFRCGLDGIVSDETFFRRRPYIRPCSGWFDDYAETFFEGDFKEFSYVLRYEEWTGCTLEWVVTHLSADKAIQYMKERGLTTCPIQM